MFRPIRSPGLRAGVLSTLAMVTLAGCNGAAGSAPPASAAGVGSSLAPSRSADSPGAAASPSEAVPSTDASAPPSNEPESGGTTAAGDIPDNAVFLTFKGTNPVFSIQYVEGWQVTRQADGVVIRDKDSSETVAIVAPADVQSYISGTDLPALQARAHFKLVKQDTVKVGSQTYAHLVFHLPAAPDPVTGKQVPSTVDRYYVPGTSGLAVISLSTPDGVDNVDAFRQMIQSFKWS
jgi:hypothetical protein